MKDLLSNTLIHCDVKTAALDSDAATSDNLGVGVSIRGYKRAIVIGTLAAPSGTSDGTAVLRLLYNASVGIASDCVDSDWSAFSTDAVTASMTFATSDLAAGEGIGILDVDLAAHGMSDGCVTAQWVLDGTNSASASAWILLSNRNGKALAQEHTVVTFP